MKRRLGLLLIAACLAATPLCSPAQSWQPDRAVEIVLGSGPDITARAMQRIFHPHRFLDVPLTVQNKVGGNVNAVPVSLGLWGLTSRLGRCG